MWPGLKPRAIGPSISTRDTTAGESRCSSAPEKQDSWAKIVEDLTSKTGIDFKNGDGPDEVHELLKELSELLSRREPGQPYTEALMDILTRLSMMAALGLVIRSRHQGTGEE